MRARDANATNSHLIRPFASADTSGYRAGENRERRLLSASGWRNARRRGVEGLAAALPQIYFEHCLLPLARIAQHCHRRSAQHCQRSRGSTACRHCQTREYQSGGRIPPRTSSGKIWQCLGIVWQCLTVLNPSHQTSALKAIQCRACV